MKIEDLIKDKRDELDKADPPQDLWLKIVVKWRAARNTSKRSVWKAAVAIFIGVTTVVLVMQSTFSKHNSMFSSLHKIPEEYKQQEANYLKEIMVLESGIHVPNMNSDLPMTWIMRELNELEEVKMVYLNDVKAYPEKEALQVLIDYYEKKIKLLKKLQLEIERTEKRNKDEKITMDNYSL